MTLIIGAGQAGLQLAESLRGLGDTGPITLVSAEPHAPYQRPPLSKGYLAGTVRAETLAFRTAAFYEQHGIELLCGEEISDIEINPDGSGHAATDHGHDLAFDRLALTTGGRPRALDIPGADLPGVHVLRTRDDTDAITARFAEAQSVVVVGGGFVGLETAATARAAGKKVTVVEGLGRLMARAVAPEVSEFYRAAHERRGTRILLSRGVTALEGDDRVRQVFLDDGTTLDADLVLVGVGMVPGTELGESLGLRCEGGIVVDGSARTSQPEIVAAGDCTVQPHPITGAGLVRLESVQNAVDQARTAAATLCGRSDVQREIPWFWSDQDTLKLQTAGLNTSHDRMVVRDESGGESISAFYYRGEQLLAVDAVNAPRDYLVVRRALTDGIDLPYESVLAGVPLKELLIGGRPVTIV